MNPPSARVDLDPIHLVEHLDPALHLAGLRRLIAEAVDEALDLRHALGLVACARLEKRVPGFALDKKMIVVAGVDGDRGPTRSAIAVTMRFKKYRSWETSTTLPS